MTNLKTIALALAASAGAGAASAEPARETISVEFRYSSQYSVTGNYRSFLYQARRACETQGARPLAQIVREHACVDELMDKLVVQMGRADLASVHAMRTGRALTATRDLASR